eukprot:771146-Rhodomonas_salina.1
MDDETKDDALGEEELYSTLNGTALSYLPTAALQYCDGVLAHTTVCSTATVYWDTVRSVLGHTAVLREGVCRAELGRGGGSPQGDGPHGGLPGAKSNAIAHPHLYWPRARCGMCGAELGYDATGCAELINATGKTSSRSRAPSLAH